jgi:hypothetical protein
VVGWGLSWVAEWKGWQNGQQNEPSKEKKRFSTFIEYTIKY